MVLVQSCSERYEGILFTTLKLAQVIVATATGLILELWLIKALSVR